MLFGESGLPGKKPDPVFMNPPDSGGIIRAGLWLPREDPPRTQPRRGSSETRLAGLCFPARR